MALNKVLSTNPPISSSLANTASNALAATMTPSAGTNPSTLNSSTSAPPAQHDAAVNAMRRLDLSEDDDSLSGDSGSDGASTPRGQTEDEGEGPQQAPAKEAPGDGPASTVGEPSKADAATTSTPVTTITQAS
ncbi:hypothetical protein DL93DRAFT_2073892 [Clavulina sp. PMI_390]|nr:hypothetical protein DL93DRAFT_2073892 [Clavulina sp. PMI_390]